MADSVLACTVRGCGLSLERLDKAWGCARGHSYDVSRHGYLNLLQPQDWRSPAAGDSKAALDARAALLARGVGQGIVDEFVRHGASLVTEPGAVVVDLGSGSGEALASLARARPILGVGIDISTAAAERAARRFPDLTWVVANADRRLPLVARSTALVLSLHARRNPAECARILRPGGALLVAVPAEDDLIELRSAVQGQGVPRDRVASVVESHAPWFALHSRWSARERLHLEAESLTALLQGTYRGARTSHAARVHALDSLEVTLASDLLCLVPIKSPG